MSDEEALSPFLEQLRSGYEYVRQMLESDDVFPAFAIVVDKQEQRKVLVSDETDPDLLRGQLEDRFRAAPPSYVMLFWEVELSDGAHRQRAIAVHVDVTGGINNLVLTPFERNGAELSFEAAEISDAGERVIRRN
jgi:hypothetical protein